MSTTLTASQSSPSMGPPSYYDYSDSLDVSTNKEEAKVVAALLGARGVSKSWKPVISMRPAASEQSASGVVFTSIHEGTEEECSNKINWGGLPDRYFYIRPSLRLKGSPPKPVWETGPIFPPLLESHPPLCQCSAECDNVLSKQLTPFYPVVEERRVRYLIIEHEHLEREAIMFSHERVLFLVGLGHLCTRYPPQDLEPLAIECGENSHVKENETVDDSKPSDEELIEHLNRNEYGKAAFEASQRERCLDKAEQEIAEVFQRINGDTDEKDREQATRKSSASEDHEDYYEEEAEEPEDVCAADVEFPQAHWRRMEENKNEGNKPLFSRQVLSARDAPPTVVDDSVNSGELLPLPPKEVGDTINPPLMCRRSHYYGPPVNPDKGMAIYSSSIIATRHNPFTFRKASFSIDSSAKNSRLPPRQRSPPEGVRGPRSMSSGCTSGHGSDRFDPVQVYKETELNRTPGIANLFHCPAFYLYLARRKRVEMLKAKYGSIAVPETSLYSQIGASIDKQGAATARGGTVVTKKMLKTLLGWKPAPVDAEETPTEKVSEDLAQRASEINIWTSHHSCEPAESNLNDENIFDNRKDIVMDTAFLHKAALLLLLTGRPRKEQYYAAEDHSGAEAVPLRALFSNPQIIEALCIGSPQSVETQIRSSNLNDNTYMNINTIVGETTHQEPLQSRSIQRLYALESSAVGEKEGVSSEKAKLRIGDYTDDTRLCTVTRGDVAAQNNQTSEVAGSSIEDNEGGQIIEPLKHVVPCYNSIFNVLNVHNDVHEIVRCAVSLAAEAERGYRPLESDVNTSAPSVVKSSEREPLKDGEESSYYDMYMSQCGLSRDGEGTSALGSSAPQRMTQTLSTMESMMGSVSLARGVIDAGMHSTSELSAPCSDMASDQFLLLEESPGESKMSASGALGSLVAVVPKDLSDIPPALPVAHASTLPLPTTHTETARGPTSAERVVEVSHGGMMTPAEAFRSPLAQKQAVVSYETAARVISDASGLQELPRSNDAIVNVGANITNLAIIPSVCALERAGEVPLQPGDDPLSDVPNSAMATDGSPCGLRSLPEDTEDAGSYSGKKFRLWESDAGLRQIETKILNFILSADVGTLLAEMRKDRFLLMKRRKMREYLVAAGYVNDSNITAVSEGGGAPRPLAGRTDVGRTLDVDIATLPPEDLEEIQIVVDGFDLMEDDVNDTLKPVTIGYKKAKTYKKPAVSLSDEETESSSESEIDSTAPRDSCVAATEGEEGAPAQLVRSGVPSVLSHSAASTRARMTRLHDQYRRSPEYFLEQLNKLIQEESAERDDIETIEFYRRFFVPLSLELLADPAFYEIHLARQERDSRARLEVDEASLSAGTLMRMHECYWGDNIPRYRDAERDRRVKMFGKEQLAPRAPAGEAASEPQVRRLHTWADDVELNEDDMLMDPATGKQEYTKGKMVRRKVGLGAGEVRRARCGLVRKPDMSDMEYYSQLYVWQQEAFDRRKIIQSEIAERAVFLQDFSKINKKVRILRGVNSLHN